VTGRTVRFTALLDGCVCDVRMSLVDRLATIEDHSKTKQDGN